MDEEDLQAVEDAPVPRLKKGPMPNVKFTAAFGRSDVVGKHPKRDEIDAHILSKDMTGDEIAKKYGLPGPWTVIRRRIRLKKLAQRAIEVRENVRKRVSLHRERKRTLQLLEHPLEMAREIGEQAIEDGKPKLALDSLDRYMAAVRIFGEVTGELGTPGQVNMTDNRQILHILSLPRADDTPEMIEQASRLGLPQPESAPIEAEFEEA